MSSKYLDPSALKHALDKTSTRSPCGVFRTGTCSVRNRLDEIGHNLVFKYIRTPIDSNRLSYVCDLIFSSINKPALIHTKTGLVKKLLVAYPSCSLSTARDRREK
jgi:hypothetical protein